MATEQDWSAYTVQGNLAAGDTLLARTVGGAGVQVPGQVVFARRVPGGPFEADWYGAFTSPGVSTVGALQLRDAPGAGGGSIVYVQATNNAVNSEYGYIGFAASGPIVISGSMQPTVDNVRQIGAPSLRYTALFAASGVITTSDAREKTWRGPAGESELAAAREIIDELGFFQWNDQVAVKGQDAARYHFGPRAQRVWAIMATHGLVDPIGADGKPGATPYAFLCFDEWDAIPGHKAVRENKGQDGAVVRMARPAVPGIAAGNRYGVRTDELALFLIAAQERRLRALERGHLPSRDIDV